LLRPSDGLFRGVLAPPWGLEHEDDVLLLGDELQRMRRGLPMAYKEHSVSTLDDFIKTYCQLARIREGRTEADLGR
jgi:hypothetical protein